MRVLDVLDPQLDTDAPIDGGSLAFHVNDTPKWLKRRNSSKQAMVKGSNCPNAIMFASSASDLPRNVLYVCITYMNILENIYIYAEIHTTWLPVTFE